jgi:hypothetical protein
MILAQTDPHHPRTQSVVQKESQIQATHCSGRTASSKIYSTTASITRAKQSRAVALLG